MEHLQYYVEFNTLVATVTPAVLQIESEFEVYMQAFREEREAIGYYKKSLYTDNIAEVDKQRNELFCGLRDAVKSACKHFKPEIRDAANNVMYIMKHYRSLPLKEYNAKSAYIRILIAQLNDSYAADVAILNLTDWLAELDAKNKAFEALMSERDMEQMAKTNLRMKQARVKLDAAYRDIVTRINALVVINGEDKYAGFIKEVNQYIKYFRTVLAQREGRRKAKKKRAEEKEESAIEASV